MRYLIKFSYDGSAYSGFQTQKGKETIQEKLEDALTIVNNHKKTYIVATGRTDKGVHALSQYAHADIDVSITEKKLKRALNSNLPDDIHVIETKEVDNNFHARYNVKEKVYKYIINVGEYNPLERNRQCRPEAEAGTASRPAFPGLWSGCFHSARMSAPAYPGNLPGWRGIRC